jgi:hypothetical protein
MLVSRMDVNVRIPLDPNMISNVHVPRPVNYDTWFDIDILSIGPKNEPVFEVDQGIPESFFLHAMVSFFELLSRKSRSLYQAKRIHKRQIFYNVLKVNLL